MEISASALGGAVGHRAVAWWCHLMVVLAIVGVLGTWRSAGSVSLNGLEGPHNGWLVVLFGLIALTGIRALSRGSWFGVVDVLGCGAVMTFTAIEDLVNDNAVLGGGAGWGLWLTVASSLVLAAAAVVVGARRLLSRAVGLGADSSSSP